LRKDGWESPRLLNSGAYDEPLALFLGRQQLLSVARIENHGWFGRHS
jgi:hypothetical protein